MFSSPCGGHRGDSPRGSTEGKAMIDLGTYKDRFAESGQRVLEHAVQESRRRDQNYIAVEHVLNALAAEEGDLFNSTMRDLALDPRSVKVLIEKRLENARYQKIGRASCRERV